MSEIAINISNKDETEIHYSREKTISITGIGIPMFGIPVIDYEPVNFYQKPILILLQNGYSANSWEDLSRTISDVLNIKTSFVHTYINQLKNYGLLTFDRYTGKFSLKDNIVIVEKNESGVTWKTRTKESKKDFWNLLYLQEVKTFIDKDELVYDFVTVGEDRQINDSSSYKQMVEISLSSIGKIIEKAFDKTCSVCKPLTYRIDDMANIKSNRYTISLRTDYVYKDGNVSFVDVFIPPEITDPALTDYIKKMKDSFKDDVKIPKFIKYRENSLNYEVEKREYEESCAKLETDLHDHEQAKKALAEAKKLKEKNEDDLKKLRRQYSDKENRNHIALAGRIIQNEDEIEKSNKVIEQKDNEVRILSCRIKDGRDLVEKQKKKMSWQDELLNNLDDSDSDNKLVKSTSLLYIDESKALDSHVKTMCVFVALALDAIDHNNEEEMYIQLGNIRSACRQTIKAVFDALLKDNRQSVAYYYNDPYCRAAITKNVSKLGPSTIDAMRELDEIQNAIAHKADNSKPELKEKNLKSLESFQKSSKDRQKQIITSVIRFFSSLKLDKVSSEKVERILKISSNA